MFNAILVLFAATEIVRDSVSDLLHRGAPPREDLMLVVAAAALVVNGVSAWLLHGAMHTHDHGHDHAHGADEHDRPRPLTPEPRRRTRRGGYEADAHGARRDDEPPDPRAHGAPEEPLEGDELRGEGGHDEEVARRVARLVSGLAARLAARVAARAVEGVEGGAGHGPVIEGLALNARHSGVARAPPADYP